MEVQLPTKGSETQSTKVVQVKNETLMMLISTKKKITEFPSKDQRVKDSEKKKLQIIFYY